MTEDTKTWRIGELREPFVFSVVVQVCLITLSAFLLDDGALGRLFGTAMAGHWLWVAWLALRRRNHLTKIDTVMIRHGFFLWVVVTILIGIGIELILEQTNPW